MTTKHRTLFNLDELTDYKVANNYSDVRGWEVRDTDNRSVGKVDHLLVNMATERVVYLDVEVDPTLIEEGFKTYQSSVSDGVHEFLNKEGENHLIIPIGMAAIDSAHKWVTTTHIDRLTFTKAKRFRKGDHLPFPYELNLMRHYKGDNSIHASNTVDGFYDRKEFDTSFLHVIF